jgi:tetratricopeptide (TPR) repeat protein
MRSSLLFRSLILGATAAVVVLSGCSREKDRWLNRRYHEVTARFNPLYNGQVAYAEALALAQEAQQDDFTQLIPVDDWTKTKSGTPAEAKAKRAVEKAAKTIQEHSMVFKGKQANPAVFDAYLLMARAQMLMGLDAPASEALSNVARLSTNPEQQVEAELERAELLARQGNSALAEPLMFELERKGVPKKWLYQVDRVRGRMAIAEQDWVGAADAMGRAAAKAPRAHQRARYAFLAGQLYERGLEPERARRMYEACLKAQPASYAMLLEAQLRRSMNGGGMSPAKLYKELRELLREPKNADFADRIYFSLGDLALQWDDRDEAYAYFQRSFAAGKPERPLVQGLAYARHGALALERRAYERAQVDFDSASALLPKSYVGRDGFVKKAQTLSVLVEALNRAQLADSLVLLAGRDPAAVRVMVEKYVAGLRKADQDAAERARREEELAELRASSAELDAAAPSAGAGTAAGWAVYAPALRAKGAAAFRQRFGERPNVDNWRLRSRSSQWFAATAAAKDGEQNDQAEQTGQDGKPEAPKTPSVDPRYDVEAYLSQVPFQAGARDSVRDAACTAWSEVAAAYRDGMQDPQEAIKAYRRALSNCPSSADAPRWLYGVYRLHLVANEALQAESAKKELLERYPDSEAATLIQGKALKSLEVAPNATPAFLALHAAVDQRSWKEALKIHQAQDWSAAERPQADFLKAMALGGRDGRNAYSDALRALIAAHPSTPQAAQAQTYLTALAEGSDIDEGPVDNGPYQVAPKAPHQILILFPTGFDANAVRNALARIHSTDFADKPLGVRTLPWDEDSQLILVDGFASAAEALSYRDKVRVHPELRTRIPIDRTRYWPVTVANFSHLYRSKDESTYRAFVQRNYGTP